jgi:hypothetical protein
MLAFDRVRDILQLKQYSNKTEGAYLNWIKQYILFHDKKHPQGMGASEVEALLARHQGDPLAEKWTHADGLGGHFSIGKEGKTYLSLLHNTTHSVILEAKIFSNLSPGLKNDRYFDQADRNVACISEVFHRANLSPRNASHVGF